MTPITITQLRAMPATVDLMTAASCGCGWRRSGGRARTCPGAADKAVVRCWAGQRQRAACVISVGLGEPQPLVNIGATEYSFGLAMEAR